ncbi:hypothetical protein [Candidatus Binatus sp.]|uniref:hypothetical protein n=1 Tax=Candidatus Binatus sp. TaxID=2811406 RepID=UPI002F924C46
MRSSIVVVALALLLTTCGYAVAEHSILRLAVAAFVIGALFLVVGAEVAVLALIDKDPEQIDDQNVRDLLTRLQSQHQAFLTGRQVVEVSLIVFMTFLAEWFFDVKRIGAFAPSADAWPRLSAALSSEKFAVALVFGLSSLIVFWFSQLVAKLFAEERPQQILGWAPTRWLIYIAIWVERAQFGAPGLWAWSLIKGRFPASEPELGPSRDKLFKYSAQLRYGRGLDSVRLCVTVGAKGEATLSSYSSFRSFGPGFNGTREDHRVEGEILKDSCRFNFICLPNGCGNESLDGPHVNAMTLKGKDYPKGQVLWDIRFPANIPEGERLEYEAGFSTSPGAYKTAAGESDFYAYTVKHPTILAEVFIVPTDGAPFIFGDGECTVAMSDDPNVNRLEGERVKGNIKPFKNGLKFPLAYPFEGSEFTFTWRILPRTTRGTGSLLSRPSEPDK